MQAHKFESGDGVIDRLPRYVDTHCHLDDMSFDEDVGEVIRSSRAVGVDRCIVVGFSPDRWGTTLDLADRYSGIFVMLGVHPANAPEWTPPTADSLDKLIRQRRPVAIGEIGLDYYRGETNEQQQEAAFSQQLDLAVKQNLPAVIHMRSAESPVIALLNGRTNLPTLVFHSFDGTDRLTDWILDHDAYIGVGGLSTREKSADLRAQLKRIPLERMVLETDAPYLTPRGFHHRRNTPQSIPLIAAHLASLRGCSIQQVAEITTRNAAHLFPAIAGHHTVMEAL